MACATEARPANRIPEYHIRDRVIDCEIPIAVVGAVPYLRTKPHGQASSWEEFRAPSYASG